MIASQTTSPIDKLKQQVACPVELALRVLGGKWRGSVLYQLKDGALRFNELKYRVQDAAVDYEGSDNYLSNKVLSGHLKALIEYELVEKTGHSEENERYALTTKGQSVMPILIDLFYWGQNKF